MTKTELMHALVEYKEEKELVNQTLAKIIQVSIDIILDDTAAESKHVKQKLEKGDIDDAKKI